MRENLTTENTHTHTCPVIGLSCHVHIQLTRHMHNCYIEQAESDKPSQNPEETSFWKLRRRKKEEEKKEGKKGAMLLAPACPAKPRTRVSTLHIARATRNQRLKLPYCAELRWSQTAAAAATCFGRAGCGQAAQLDQGRKSLQPMGRAKGCRNHRAVSYLHSKAASHRRSVSCWKEIGRRSTGRSIFD